MGKKSKPNWLLSSKQLIRFDCAHICIFIPTLYKQTFQFVLPMKYTGYLKQWIRQFFYDPLCYYLVCYVLNTEGKNTFAYMLCLRMI